MFPAYGFKHAYPQGRAPMSADCRHHPTSEGLHPQMKMEASPSPFLHETWPHHYTYPVPTQFHSCCNHNAYPNYYPYRPPYPHFPSPPLHPQCYGGYPVLPEPYPFQYPPPPHYTMQLPNYEYDKSFLRESHCRGCHCHTPDIKGDKGVKIEEQESEAEEVADQSVKRISEGADHQERPSFIMPLDVESLKKLLLDGNLKRDHDDQPKNQSHQMPFPVIWLPHNNEESSSRQQSLKSEQGDDHTKKSIPPVGAEGGKAGKILSQKMEEPADDMKTNNIEEGKNSTENGTKKKTTSPSKASKMPPVCLRVDPLPKRKNNSVKVSSPTGVKKEINIVDMEDRSRSIEIEMPSKNAGDENQRGEKQDVGQKAEEIQEAVEKKKPERRVLSGTEAAVMIQSAYRGYEVRRLEPLKKMRQIANIRDEASAVKTCIESCASSSMDLKRKITLGETIMNLLLKLDTVQGMHSSIRDFRKSVAKELVSLQEMLDTIEVDDSGDQDNLKNDIKPELPQTVDEGSDPPVTEPDQPESDEASKAEISIQQEDETVIPEMKGECQQVLEPLTEAIDQALVAEENEHEEDKHDDETTKEIVHELDAKPSEDADEGEQKAMVHDLDANDQALVAEENTREEDKHNDEITEEIVHDLDAEPAKDADEGERKAMVHDLDAESAEEADDQAVVAEENTREEEKHDNETTKEIVHDLDAKPAKDADEGEQKAMVHDLDAKSAEEANDQALVAGENAREEDKHNDETTKEIIAVRDLDAEPAMEENERMRSLLEKLIEAEKKQQEVISSLNEKLKELEGKLGKQKQQKKKKSTRTRAAKVLIPRSCKTSKGFSKGAPLGLAS